MIGQNKNINHRQHLWETSLHKQTLGIEYYINPSLIDCFSDENDNQALAYISLSLSLFLFPSPANRVNLFSITFSLFSLPSCLCLYLSVSLSVIVSPHLSFSVHLFPSDYLNSLANCLSLLFLCLYVSLSICLPASSFILITLSIDFLSLPILFLSLTLPLCILL